jgi:small subunit ribosomal protein S14
MNIWQIVVNRLITRAVIRFYMYQKKSLLLWGGIPCKVLRDIRRRILFSIYEPERIQLKMKREDPSLSIVQKMVIQRQLDELPKDSAPSRIKNRCVLSGDAHSVYRHFKLSRWMICELARNGDLPGIRKSSW